MPKSRQPRSIWFKNRENVFNRCGGRCAHCKCEIKINKCHIDHIQSGKRGSNHFKNLRALCVKCHALREDHRHRGLRRKYIENAIIPPNWRDLAWE